MEVTRELLMAFADGELDEITARRVEQAIADDPELASQLAAERALQGKLQAHFEPVSGEPIPAVWTAMIAEAAEEDARVVSLADARKERESRAVPRWGAGVAIAASLVLGVMLGTQIAGGGGPLAESGDVLLASAGLAKALDGQLAAESEGADVRMLASFRRDGGAYCRVFSGKALSGIACHEGKRWQLERLVPGGTSQETQYRQAGSAEAQLLAEAQDMAVGEPLDAAQEKAARDRGWQQGGNR